MSADPVSFPAPTQPAVFYWSPLYRTRTYGANHPLSIPRVPLTFDLISAYGAITPAEVAEPRVATEEELHELHAPDYIAALREAEHACCVSVASRERYRLGTLENPYFDHFFTIPAKAAGASIEAAGAVMAGRLAFNAAGGMHHARRDHARGFCFLNDPGLAIARFRSAGWRVLYVDIDAHHGDGVELAFADDPEVLTLSLHMDTAYAYPFSGGRFEDQGSARGGHSMVNLPLPAETGDFEFAHVFDAAWHPLIESFRPDAVVVQAGADMLAHDPLGKMKLSSQEFLRTVGKIVAGAPRHADGTPRVLVTGGGGYHPILTARAWCGIWGILSGRELPWEIPEAGASILHACPWDVDEDEAHFASLFVSRRDGPAGSAQGRAGIRPEIRQEIRGLAARIGSHAFFAARKP